MRSSPMRPHSGFSASGIGMSSGLDDGHSLISASSVGSSTLIDATSQRSHSTVQGPGSGQQQYRKLAKVTNLAKPYLHKSQPDSTQTFPYNIFSTLIPKAFLDALYSFTHNFIAHPAKVAGLRFSRMRKALSIIKSASLASFKPSRTNISAINCCQIQPTLPSNISSTLIQKTFCYTLHSFIFAHNFIAHPAKVAGPVLKPDCLPAPKAALFELSAALCRGFVCSNSRN
ncbi:hypothetical protein DdX_16912 [Ditylenchus destructor]|uniref:Uncharacterized protein n=1 Tax=Ditylenchus destructor TaxID=166010 RepID=A0AAD4MML3_9BILA|nr:hypothetical protein DdX_16912 [Ditylenchus destructor]